MMSNRNYRISTICLLVVFLFVKLSGSSYARKVQKVPLENGTSVLKFGFGTAKTRAGYKQVLSTTTYTRDGGYGFEPGSTVECFDRGGSDPRRAGNCTGDKPFFFSVAVPEGNYNVTVTFGDRKSETTTTVRAELRRLMLEKIHTAPGKFETRTFTVNVRTPQIS